MVLVPQQRQHERNLPIVVKDRGAECVDAGDGTSDGARAAMTVGAD